MKDYKLTVTTKTGQKFTNYDTVDQKFVTAIYNALSTGEEMVIQIATSRTVAVMLSVKNIDYVTIKLLK